MSDQFNENQFFETAEQPQVQEQHQNPDPNPDYLPPQSPFYREDVIMQMQIREQVEKEQERLRQKALRRQQRRVERQTHGWKFGVAILSLITLCASTFGGVYWASTLLNRTHDTNQTGTFFFPSDEKAVKEVADITALQNSEYTSIADIADDVGHSVVTIVTTVVAQDPSGIMGDAAYGEALGSGVIIGESEDELYIATNFHVINNATDVKVLMGSDETVSATAYYKGSDSGSDLAVIYVKKSDLDEDTLKEIKIATLGDSDSLKVGDLAIAIGSPVNKTYSNTVTAGIISGLERSVSFKDEDTGLVNTLILLQTDAAINPGNSGGALVNGRGEIIGINDAKIVSSDVEGMGFAIPISTAKPVLEELINHGKVIQPYLGITGSGIDAASEFAVTYGMFSGVYVQSVLEGLSADKAGIQVDDVIIEFNGQKIDTFKDLTDALHACEIGQTVEVKVVRGYVDGDPETVTLSLTIQEKPGDFD
ncbi:MAG: trypsin-like peptidase domain-containing protein [Clostridiales bacterium]|nr:trypsin-like peptidase domain-containing protein [Clostridiales bacterium]